MRFPLLAIPAGMLWIVSWFLSAAEKPTHAEPFPFVQAIRESFANELAPFGGDGAALVPGLVLGDTSRVSESLTNAMRVSSLAHLTAVSGANCAVIVSVVFGLCALVGLSQAWRATISLLSLAAFVALVGAEPSVVRAAVMAVIALVALVAGRPATGLTVVSAAVCVCLVLDPSLSRSIGFALSVAATVGLLVLTVPLEAVFERIVPVRVARMLSIPVAAQLAVQPLLLVFSPRISTYGVFANIIAEPLAPIATISGLLALILGFLPWLSLPFALLAWLSGSVIAAIARTASALPLATIPWPAGSIGIGAAVVVTAGVAWSVIRRRWLPSVTAFTITLAALTTTIGGGVAAWASAPRDWRWAQCDVGQGDAVVVRDGDRFILIDTGRDERLLRDCLTRLGVDRISLLVLTHFDIDHVGAYGAILGQVDAVIHGPTDGIADEVIVEQLRIGGARMTRVERGSHGNVGLLSWRVLWPTSRIPTEPGNPSSVVVALTPSRECENCISGIDLGDLPAHEQSMMVGLGGIGHVDVVKVSHHGSKDQSPELYQRIRAPIALIGVGAGNEYGHPTEFARDLMASVGSATTRTDRDGIAMVSLTASGQLRVWTERAG